MHLGHRIRHPPGPWGKRSRSLVPTHAWTASPDSRRQRGAAGTWRERDDGRALARPRMSRHITCVTLSSRWARATTWFSSPACSFHRARGSALSTWPWQGQLGDKPESSAGSPRRVWWRRRSGRGLPGVPLDATCPRGLSHTGTWGLPVSEQRPRAAHRELAGRKPPPLRSRTGPVPRIL